jgi:SIR2-like domain
MPIVLVSDSDAPVQFARRGNQWLDDRALRAHLAALLRLENIGVFLGAGASVQLGGRLISQLWNDFMTTYTDDYIWLLDQQFIPETAEENPDFENILDSLTIAGIEWQRTNSPEFATLVQVENNLRRILIRGALLNEGWWSDPTPTLDAPPELQNHRRLLQKLCAARQPGQSSPWVFTTNYDLAVEWAAESLGLYVANGFAGLHSRVFSPHNFDLGLRNTLARGEARFGTYSIYLSKLHGSLSWQSNNGLVSEQAAAATWPFLSQFLNGQDAQSPFLVFPEAAKYIQTASFVFGELIRRLTEFLARPQACLMISGYSFSDDHINRVLRASVQNPTLQLVVYLPELSRNDDGLVFPQGKERWLRALDSPQVTFVGSGERAWFQKLVEQLPDPAIYDEQALVIRRTIRELEQSELSVGQGPTNESEAEAEA